MSRAWIAGTGSYLPEQIKTNAEVCAGAPGCSAEFIVEKLGIHERRIAANDEQTSDLAVHAALKALEAAKISPEQLDGIICSVGTGDVQVPATACYIQKKLGVAAQRAFAVDIKAACAGAVGGTMMARGLIESGISKNVLVVGTQIISRTTLDWTDRRTAPIFGDGAGAVVMTAAPPDHGFLQSRFHTDGSLTDIVGIYKGGTLEAGAPELMGPGDPKLEMNGRAVWNCALEVLPKAVHDVVTAEGYTVDDVDFVVSHQANKRLLYHVLEKAGIPLNKSYTNIEHYGNTVAASAFIALDETVRKGLISRGDLIVLLAIGAGMTWGAHLIRW